MNDILWELFRKTGNIKYYLLVKSLEGDTIAEEKDSRNSNK